MSKQEEIRDYAFIETEAKDIILYDIDKYPVMTLYLKAGYAVKPLLREIEANDN